ncbi:hypothetical protein AB833_25350 [Chromatiales bacterium (ex Bugula neritina AB1)]|nr:hypothetical protein AB833_25350 [Chromatiales bacterium (ex Bugula neritina AB1)]
MEKWQVGGLLFVGLLLVAGAIFVRARYGEQFALKPIDLVLVALPLLFVLLVSGKVKVFEAFGVKADLSELIADAASTEIRGQAVGGMSPDVGEVVEMLEMAGKAGVGNIPELVTKKTEALTFKLGHGGYIGDAVKQYVDALSASSYLRFIVLLDTNDQLFCIYNALDLQVYYRTASGAYNNFADAINGASEDNRRWLATLPGFVGAADAVRLSASKRQALQKMSSLRIDNLPVVNDEGNFVGTINRTNMTASMLLSIVDRLENDTSQK